MGLYLYQSQFVITAHLNLDSGNSDLLLLDACLHCLHCLHYLHCLHRSLIRTELLSSFPAEYSPHETLE